VVHDKKTKAVYMAILLDSRLIGLMFNEKLEFREIKRIELGTIPNQFFIAV